MQAKIQRVHIEPGRRILAVSDIHGERELFFRLLQKMGFCEEDELFLCGDIIEKGGESLRTLHAVMELSAQKRVHVLMGNCDSLWMDIASDQENEQLLHYMLYRGRGILHDMCARLGIKVSEGMDLLDAKRQMRKAFARELDWLSRLPHIIDAGRLCFVHAGLRSQTLEGQTDWDVMKYDEFLDEEQEFPYYVVAGHMPVSNVNRRVADMNPVIDQTRRKIGIDGGNAIRLGGQLNGLILPDVDSDAFSFAACDALPLVTVLQGQEASEDPVNIVWRENEVELLEQGEEFSLCRHPATGKTLWIAKEELLNYRDGSLHCGTGTDYRLGVHPGEQISLARRYRDWSLCKKNGILGWVENRRLQF